MQANHNLFWFCFSLVKKVMQILYSRVKPLALKGPVYVEKSWPGEEGHPPCRVNFSERLYEQKVDPFARANSAHACSDCLALMELTRLGKAKCLIIWRKVGPARRVTLPSKKGDPARRVTLPVEPTFCFSCKQFTKFCKEMTVGKVGSPRVAWVGE